MEMTRDLFQKIRDAKGKFHVKMGSIKDRNGLDPTEAEEKAMAPHSSALAWEIPRREEPDGLQSMGLQRAEQD